MVRDLVQQTLGLAWRLGHLFDRVVGGTVYQWGQSAEGGRPQPGRSSGTSPYSGWSEDKRGDNRWRVPAVEPATTPSAVSVQAKRHPSPEPMNKLLADDSVKLVFYSLVSIQRTRERVLETKAVVVSESMTAESFVIWRIAEYLQEAQRKTLPPEQRKYLRVHYEVRERWPKTDLRFQSRQLAHLEGIRKAIIEPPSIPAQSKLTSLTEEPSGARDDRAPVESAPGPAGDSSESVAEGSEDLEQSLAIPTGELSLTASGELILETFENREGPVAMRDLVAHTGLSRSILAREVKALMELGRVERIGKGFATRYVQVLS